MPDDNTDITAASTTLPALEDLKQELLTTLRQDLAKMVHRKIAPIKTNIQQLTEDSKTKTEQLTNALFTIQQQMNAQFAQLSMQIAAMHQPLPSSKPPPPTNGGGIS